MHGNFVLQDHIQNRAPVAVVAAVVDSRSHLNKLCLLAKDTQIDRKFRTGKSRAQNDRFANGQIRIAEHIHRGVHIFCIQSGDGRFGGLRADSTDYCLRLQFNRSIPRQFVIVDEAQNLTPHEVKTIVSRAGEDTKMVFTGDPDQIDNPYLDASSNGLTYMAERFKKVSMHGHITLKKSERSPLAAAAAAYL